MRLLTALVLGALLAMGTLVPASPTFADHADSQPQLP